MKNEKTVVDIDYAEAIVPKSARSGIVTMSMIMLGFTFFSASMLVGQQLAAGLDFQTYVQRRYFHAIIQAAKDPPTGAENRFYWLWICFGKLLPLLLYGAVSTVEGGTTGFWRLALTGYIQWMVVNVCDLLFLDLWLIQRKAKRRFIIPGTEGHPGYGFKAWMKSYALPEHLLQWPLILCPLLAAIQAGLGLVMNALWQAV